MKLGKKFGSTKLHNQNKFGFRKWTCSMYTAQFNSFLVQIIFRCNKSNRCCFEVYSVQLSLFVYWKCTQFYPASSLCIRIMFSSTEILLCLFEVYLVLQSVFCFLFEVYSILLRLFYVYSIYIQFY